MLSHIVGIIQEFERSHGRRPQLVYLNQRHLAELMEECPGLFDDETTIPLSFRIVVLPESELPHPKAVWLPPPRMAFRGARVSTQLLAFRNRQSLPAQDNKRKKE